MPCSHAGGGSDRRGDRGVDRRDFLRSAVAIGGSSALAACLDREDADPPTGQISYSYPDTDLPSSQHDWDRYLVTDPHGNTLMPQHNVLLFLEYADDGTPSQQERDRVEAGFRTLERAYQWGTGDSFNAVINEGLLFMVSYSNSYFDRFDEDLPVDLPRAETLIEELDEEATPDSYDAAVYLASGRAQIVLGAEEALRGNVDELNGVAVEGGLEGVMDVAERRTGFVGQTHPSRKVDEVDDDVDIQESAPLFMGFKSGYTDNIPPDDRVSIDQGPFEDGTTQQISQLTMDLESWYGKEHGERVHQMYSPDHTSDEVGEAGHELASNSGMTPEMTEDLQATADEEGVLGHGQKTAAARDDEEFLPKVVRRDFDTTHDDRAGLAFVGLQRRIEDFVELREAMNADDVDLPEERNGILDFLQVERRGTFLVPPRRLRSLPTPDPA